MRHIVRSAFTLIELLVVVAIIALLISILAAHLNGAKKQTRATVCMSNMRQIAMGWLMYTHDWDGNLPGSTWDFIPPANYNRGKTFCWLGTINGKGGDQPEHVPSKGTIFRYVGQQAAVYKCPEDSLEKRAEIVNGQIRTKPLYSYTAPPLLSGAPTSLLKRTRWPENFGPGWNYETDWNIAAAHSQPWMALEEDAGKWLAYYVDSAWSNIDIITDRHRGKGCVSHIDGSVSLRRFQRFPADVDAWHVYYELTDGRVVSASGWDPGPPKFGFLRTAPGLNP